VTTELKPEDHVAKFQCKYCRHVQAVMPAKVWLEAGVLKGTFGSDADFCEVCDGPVDFLPKAHGEVTLP